MPQFPIQDNFPLSERPSLHRHGDVQPERLRELPDPDPSVDVHGLPLHPDLHLHGIQCEVRENLRADAGVALRPPDPIVGLDLHRSVPHCIGDHCTQVRL